ncbi:MAG: aminoacyl--tRNA ligase-related protein [Thermoplasmatota archaeon]
MEFRLRAILEFSGTIEDAKDDINELIEDANSDLLKRGIPTDLEDGGAEVAEYSLDDDTIDLEIFSDRYVRAHDALLRLRKKFGQELGPEYHVGVRNIKIQEYDITFDLESEPKDEFDLPFVKKITFDDDSCIISVGGLTEEQLSKNYVDRIIKRVREKVDAQYYEGKEEKWELIWESGEMEHVWDKDPTEVMEEKGWIKKGPTKGKWFYRPQAAKILKTMEKIAVEEILKPLGFQEIIESMMVPFDVWVETGHMEGIPNEAYYISEPKTRNPEEWEEIIDEIKISKKVPTDKLDEMTTHPKSGVCYAQCPVIYWSFRGETIADDDLPVLVYEKSIPSARYESGGRHGIERVDEFHRIEPVYIGTKEQLLELKEDLIEKYKHVFEDILELEWRIANVEPFYLQQSGNKKEEIDTELGTIDFEAYLPYRGNREESEWLEFQNLSIFRKYTESFNIKSQSHTLYSGCTGIGLERWTAAFLAQKGLDREKWPEKFKKKFGKMPRGFKLM